MSYPPHLPQMQDAAHDQWRQDGLVRLSLVAAKSDIPVAPDVTGRAFYAGSILSKAMETVRNPVNNPASRLAQRIQYTTASGLSSLTVNPSQIAAVIQTFPLGATPASATLVVSPGLIALKGAARGYVQFVRDFLSLENEIATVLSPSGFGYAIDPNATANRLNIESPYISTNQLIADSIRWEYQIALSIPYNITEEPLFVPPASVNIQVASYGWLGAGVPITIGNS